MTWEPADLYCEVLDDLVSRCDPESPEPAQLEAVEAHLRQCEICRGAESALSKTVSEFRSADPHGVSARFEEALVDRLCRTKERPTQGGS